MLVVAYLASYAVGAGLSFVLLQRRVGGLEAAQLLRFLVRMALVLAAAGAAAWLVELALARRIVLEPPTGAPIALTETGPCVEVEAGALFRAIIPSCTCDACDETAESAADELERTLLAVAAGGLRERFPVGRRAWQLTQLVSLGGEGRSRSSGAAPELPEEVREQKAAVLRDLDDGWWPAWPLRAAPSA